MTTTQPETKLNCLLITVDSLRADHVGAYRDGAAVETPVIDALAEQATVFDRCLAQGAHTGTSCLALLSGCYASKYGDWFGRVSPARPLMGETLRAAGYETAAFHSNPFISHHQGFDRGFDIFVDNMPATSKGRPSVWKGLRRFQSVLREPYEAAETINRQALDHLSSAGRPWFYWVHYMDVHGPYVSRKGSILANRIRAARLWKKVLHDADNVTPGERDYLIACYREKIALMDRSIGELLTDVDLDRTVVILSADHGDLLGEHGMYGHSTMLYEGVLHVPLIVKHPLNNRRRNIPGLVRLMDFLPSITELLGVETPTGCDGRSFAPAVIGEAETASDEPVVSELSRKQLCVEHDGWKLIVDHRDNTRQLFQIRQDPAEAHERSAAEPEKMRELEAILDRHLEQNSPEVATRTKMEQDDELKERLKALGYL